MNPVVKGLLGEEEVKLFLIEYTKQFGGYFLSPAIVPIDDTVTQVDFIVFTKHLMACIEVKSWAGEVIVPQFDESWKIIYKNKITTTCNPFQQNSYHCKAVDNNSVCGIRYDNLVLFPDTTSIYNKQKYTINMDELLLRLNYGVKDYSDSVIEKEYLHFKKLTEDNYYLYMLREFMHITI